MKTEQTVLTKTKKANQELGVEQGQDASTTESREQMMKTGNINFGRTDYWKENLEGTIFTN